MSDGLSEIAFAESGAPKPRVSRFPEVTVEFRGQVIDGLLLRSFLFLRRVWIPTTEKTFLIKWVAKWKVLNVR